MTYLCCSTRPRRHVEVQRLYYKQENLQKIIGQKYVKMTLGFGEILEVAEYCEYPLVKDQEDSHNGV